MATSHSLIVWPRVYERYPHILREPVLLVEGVMSRRAGTMNIVLSRAEVLAQWRRHPRPRTGNR